jgi:uncharacterized YccA/Bax inhibitor family protein
MGLWMGAVSRVSEFVYEGIVGQALLASVCAFLACLVLHLSRAIPVTPWLTRVIVIAVGGIILLYLIRWILSLFGVNPRFMSEPTILGIVISVAICIVRRSTSSWTSRSWKRGSRPVLQRRWSGMRRSACRRR